MALNFPNAPAVGALWPSPAVVGVPVYRWDGIAWSSSGSANDKQAIYSDGSVPMVAQLTLITPPVANTDAAAKQYVDSKVAAGVTSFKARTGAVVPVQGDYPSALIPGTVTNDNAAAGNIGEYQEANVAGGSSVALPTGTPKDVVTMSLTAGDWEVWGHVFLNNIGATGTLNWFQVAISTGAANSLPGGLVGFGGAMPSGCPANLMPNNSVGFHCLPVRVSLAATTTVRLVCQVQHNIPSFNGYGWMKALRVR